MGYGGFERCPLQWVMLPEGKTGTGTRNPKELRQQERSNLVIRFTRIRRETGTVT